MSGKTIPAGEDVPPLTFGWRPLPNNERRLVAVPALLAERYVYSSQAWAAEGLGIDGPRDGTDVRAPDGLSQRCMQTLETLLAADATTCDLMIQFILAPPPPSAEMDVDEMQLESARPLGSSVVNLLAECCAKAVGAAGAAHAARGDYAVGERAANVLSLLFTCGGTLARELSTAISTAHTSLGGGGAGFEAVPAQPLLPFLLSSAGRAARVSPHGGGHALLVAVLRLLSTAAAGCEPAAKLLLDDPSNFFVLDLATAARCASVGPPGCPSTNRSRHTNPTSSSSLTSPPPPAKARACPHRCKWPRVCSWAPAFRRSRTGRTGGLRRAARSPAARCSR